MKTIIFRLIHITSVKTLFKTSMMKKIFFSNSKLLIVVSLLLITVYACKKESSFENPNNPNSNVIIGANCRIDKIAFSDSTSDIGIGSVSAVINAFDTTTSVTIFDSLGNNIIFNAAITYANDTAYINPDEFFVLDINNRVNRMHVLLDPQDPASPQIDVDYTYDGGGHLVKKSYAFTLDPDVPFQEVNYTYTNNNLTGMTKVDLTSNDILQNAVLNYDNSISPKNFIYIFPDEEAYSPFTQFLNFGVRSANAVKGIAINYFNPGNIPAGSTLSTFNNYILSLDNYVVSATMTGDDLESIPAPTGRLKFNYKCK